MRFKVNDTVFHWAEGEGVISRIYDNSVTVDFEGASGPTYLGVKAAESTLSFKPYDLVTGGFSAERVLPSLKEGTIIYVKSNLNIWELRYFQSFDPQGRAITYRDQKPEGPTTTWSEYSLTNPLTED